MLVHTLLPQLGAARIHCVPYVTVDTPFRICPWSRPTYDLLCSLDLEHITTTIKYLDGKSSAGKLIKAKCLLRQVRQVSQKLLKGAKLRH